MIRPGLSLCGLLLVACGTAPVTTTVSTTPSDSAPSPPDEIAPVASPAAAFRAGWMPLGATGVAQLRSQEPDLDGRGVLIAILDSGIDPGVAGLHQTSQGRRKILDLRDFSGEGRVELAPVASRGDQVVVAGQTISGMARVRSFVSGQLYGGAVLELDLAPPLVPQPGEPLAADLDGNGSATDTLPLIVGETIQGWAVFADTDRDGSLADERPVHDYATAPEIFGWHHQDGPSPMAVAVNFETADEAPRLDLFFDNSGHGTHVAGIAAGHDMYDVAGFDGVAPGAYLLGIKIADNSRGGISATGAMERGLEYAVDYARQRGLPLVVNLSFGIGNEIEGTAVIDSLVDSLLAAHPSVVMTVSAGNDGPGISTVGFPASAQRPITVGATFPVLFLRQPASAQSLPDPVAFFSARGGMLSKPELVAPGVAYSTVPQWDRGSERNGGTSMAAPHVAGLAAILIDDGSRRQVRYPASRIKQLLMASSAPLPNATALDDGAGQPNIVRALSLARGVAPGETGVTVAVDRFPPDMTPVTGDRLTLSPEPMEPGAVRRIFFQVQTGQPFGFRVATGRASELVLASLHLPGGQPAPGAIGLTAGAGLQAAEYRMDAGSVRPGLHELAIATPPVESAAAGVTLEVAPVSLALASGDTTVEVLITNLSQDTIAASAGLNQVGAERRYQVGPSGPERVILPVAIPPWAGAMELEVRLPVQQWGLFTDFGVSLLDSLGHMVLGGPMNYAHERLRLALDEVHRGRGFLLELAPGYARTGAGERWSATVSARFYRDPQEIDAAPHDLILGPGRGGTITFNAGRSPWPLDEGLKRLFRATVAARGSWTVEGTGHTGAPRAANRR